MSIFPTATKIITDQIEPGISAQIIPGTEIGIMLVIAERKSDGNRVVIPVNADHILDFQYLEFITNEIKRQLGEAK